MERVEIFETGWVEHSTPSETPRDLTVGRKNNETVRYCQLNVVKP